MNRGITFLAACALAAGLSGCAQDKAGEQASAAAQPAAEPKRETITGPAIAEDGDTVIIGDQSIDLWGVEAPDLGSADGWYSRAALDRFIGENGELVCIIKVKRKRARDQAVCSNNKVGDLGRAMLLNGWAVVARRDKQNKELDTALVGVYERTEQRARQTRAGLWTNFPLK